MAFDACDKMLSVANVGKSSLEGKLGIVFGVANRRSIALAIAKSWHEAGARLAFTYQNERLKDSVEELVATLDSEALVMPCDVTRDDEIEAVFAKTGEVFGGLDLLLHSVAFAPREALNGRFLDTLREAFRMACEINTYSLIALARGAAPLMSRGGSIITLSYYGAQKVVPHYNVMGVAKASLEAATRYLAADLGQQQIRVNCISAGPMNTLAARGIPGFAEMEKRHAEQSPLRRRVMPEEIGATATFLASDGAAAVTGQVIYVDGGHSVMWFG